MAEVARALIKCTDFRISRGSKHKRGFCFLGAQAKRAPLILWFFRRRRRRRRRRRVTISFFVRRNPQLAVSWLFRSLFNSFGIFWILLESIWIFWFFWNLLESFDSYWIFRSSCSSLAGLGLEQYSVLRIPFLESFGIFWNLLESFGIIWNLFESFWFFWTLLHSFGFFWILLDVFGINWILFEYFGFVCLCRLSLKAVSASSYF